jgi:hypothetical protein
MKELLIGGPGSGTLPHWDAPVPVPVYVYVVKGRKVWAQVEVLPSDVPDWLRLHKTVGGTNAFFSRPEWERFAAWCRGRGGLVQEVGEGKFMLCYISYCANIC